jgi:cell division protein FtsZ
MADQVLYMGVRGVTDLMMVHGLVNLDFADIRTVMAEMGKAMMGTGEAEGENRAIRAAEAAINNPLLEDTSMSGARGLLINITGGEDLTLFEVDQAANRIREEVDEEANVIFGSAVDETLSGRIRVSVVATGIDSHKTIEQTRPKLVAVGGGAAPAPAPIVMRNSAQSTGAPSFMPSAVQAAAPTLLRQASSQSETAAGMEAHAQQSGLHGRPIQQQHSPRLPEPLALLNEKASLFAASQRSTGMPPHEAPMADPGRPNLFNAVTGAFRRRAMPAFGPSPQPIRREPAMEEYQPENAPAPVQSTPDQTGLEIPAFLRRQHSH